MKLVDRAEVLDMGAYEGVRAQFQRRIIEEKRLRRVALFSLDDASRYALGVAVSTSESTQLFLRAVFDVLLEYGFMNALYLDHGSGFISDDTLEVFARLKIPPPREWVGS